MSGRDLVERNLRGEGESSPTVAPPRATAEAALTEAQACYSSSSVIIGELIALTDDGRTSLVLYPGQIGAAAVVARSTIDIHGAHIGRQVVLMFDGGDASKPIVMGILNACDGWPLSDRPAQVGVDADGQRMVVSAKEQLVLRCGKASITLTKSGQVFIRGTYLASRSSGVNRIKGGSVQIN